MENERCLKKKISKKIVKICLFLTILVGSMPFMMGCYYERNVYINLEKITVELGEELPKNLLNYMNIVIADSDLVIEDSVPKDKKGRTNKIGTYYYYLVYNDSSLKISKLTNAKSTITVVDTTKPEIKFEKDIFEFAYGSEIKASDIATCLDLSTCILEFDNDIDSYNSGVYNVNIVATDEAGNTESVPVEIKILEKPKPVYYGYYYGGIEVMNNNNNLRNSYLSLEEKESLRYQIVNYAKQFVGNAYVYGGNSLTNGTDCSGFTMLTYANFGYQLPRVATSQGYMGVEINPLSLMPGDLIVYYYDNGGGHVGMYIGDGFMVHAGTQKTGITIARIFEGFKTYRRVIY